jgi:arylsulfatase A-like enzyme
MARRLVERGVRFVQLYMNAAGGPNPWDHHADVKGGLESACRQTDQPIGALLKDLKERGLLDSTLVTWGGEFGRLPLAQKGDKPGRDHGAKGFSVWMAGGGIKGGVSYGATDDFGYAAVESRVSVHDYHATILHCLGLNHLELVYSHNGLDERLTGVTPAKVVAELLA